MKIPKVDKDATLIQSVKYVFKSKKLDEFSNFNTSSKYETAI